MQVSVRSYLTAGVAFVGAGAIALTPVQPLEPRVELQAAVTQTANVALTSTENPIQLWLDVLQASAGNIGALGQAVLADPAPVLGQAIKNQLGYGRAVFEGLEGGVNQALDSLKTLPAALRNSLTYLAAGNIVDGVQALLDPIMGVGLAVLLPIVPIVESISAMAQNLANVVGTIANPSTVLAIVLSIGGPILSAVNAVVEQTQDVVDGLKGGNLGNVIKAVLNIPAALVGAILNGHGNIVFSGIPLPAAGLLTPFDNILSTGIFGALQNLRVEIGNAIKPPAPEALLSVEETDSTPQPDDSAVADSSTDVEVVTEVVDDVEIVDAPEIVEVVDVVEVVEVVEVEVTEELPIDSTMDGKYASEEIASVEEELVAETDEEVANETAESIAEERDALTGAVTEDAETETDAGPSTSTGGGSNSSGGLSGDTGGDSEAGNSTGGEAGGESAGDSDSGGSDSSE